jgi:hypothetical protein
VQFYASTLDFVINWKKEMEKEYVDEVRSIFGEKALTFSTIMESI